MSCKKGPRLWPHETMTYGNSIRILAERSWCYDVALPPVSAKIELFTTPYGTLSVRARACIRPGELLCCYAVIIETRLFDQVASNLDALEVLPACQKKKIDPRETQTFGNESHFICYADLSEKYNACFGDAHTPRGAPDIARASPIVAAKKIRKNQEILLGYYKSSASLPLTPSVSEFLPGTPVVFTSCVSSGDQGFVRFKSAALYAYRDADDTAHMLMYDAQEKTAIWKERPYAHLHPMSWMYQRDSYQVGDMVYYRMVDEEGYWRWIFATVLAHSSVTKKYSVQVFGFLPNGARPMRHIAEAGDLWLCVNEDAR